MFYSHEVLTSRKYGVATVWLVATLGLKSSLKKVSRKAILDVDVSRACEAVVTPEAPMALRLQSNLLYVSPTDTMAWAGWTDRYRYGITRVYSQQCGYVLTDLEAARNSMRIVLRTLKQADLDVEGANKGRLDQLLLQDDPNFLPDFDLRPLEFDTILATVTAHAAVESQQTSLSPHSLHSATASQMSVGGLMIPPSQSSFSAGPMGGSDHFSARSGPRAGRRIEQTRMLEDQGLDLFVDADGNMHFDDEPRPEPHRPTEPVDHTGIPVGGRGHQGMRDLVEDDGHLLPDEDMAAQPARIDGSGNGTNEDIEVQQETSSQSAQAPLRKHRRQKSRVIPLDPTTQLRNSDLSRWQTDYLENMRNGNKNKRAAKLSALAKKNAQYWVLGPLLDGGSRGPLDLFSGARLLEAFTGVALLPGGLKRAHEDEDEEGGGGGGGGPDPVRRVRSRSDDGGPVDETARGAFEGDDFGASLAMDEQPVEQGRAAPTPLDDRLLSSTLPWNQSAGSRRRADAVPRSASLANLGRRGSRTVSASPLRGRGPPYGAGMFGGLDLVPGSADVEMGGAGGGGGGDGFHSDDFAAAGVETVDDSRPQWQSALLPDDSANFRHFVLKAIREADQARALASQLGDAGDTTLQGRIGFDAIFPPHETGYVVAVQALVHVLTLGTRSILGVEQHEAFGPINLRFITGHGNVKEMIEDDDDGMED